MQETTNLKLKKPDLTDNVNISDFNENADIIDEAIDNLQQNFATHQADYEQHPAFAIATGEANNYLVNLKPAPTAYEDGLGVVVAINSDSTGASTLNVNGLGAIPIKKANGNDVTNLKANGVYTLRYSAGNFILQGEGGSGNALASDLLSGKTASTDAGEIVGTMPNRGAFKLEFGENVPEGYYNGGSVPEAYIGYLVPGDHYAYKDDTKFRCHSGKEYTLAKEVTMNYRGRIRLRYELRVNGTSGIGNSIVFVNGVPGVEREIRYSSGRVAYEEDHAVEEGDVIQIFVKTDKHYGYIRNLYIGISFPNDVVSPTIIDSQ